MPQGTIKKLVADRGFGFISGGSEDVFFHMSSVTGATFEDLHEGQTVEFEVDDEEEEDGGGGHRRKGPRASTVRPAG